MSDPLDKAKVAVEVVKSVMELASDTPELKDAGKNLSTTALTITKTINNVLLPIAAVNYAFDRARDYFETRFQADLEEVTKDIPLEDIVEPNASIAAPALQGIAFSYDEKNLKQMYLKLLSTSMDGRVENGAHPAFAEVIKQLSADEAGLLLEFLKQEDILAIAKVRIDLAPRNGYYDAYTHLMDFKENSSGENLENSRFPAMIDNWIRLGLVEVSYSENLSKDGAYDWVENRPEFHKVRRAYGDNNKVIFGKGLIRATSFGNDFRKAVA